MAPAPRRSANRGGSSVDPVAQKAQYDQQLAVQRRMNMFARELPGMENQGDLLLTFASADPTASDDEILKTVIQTVGLVEIKRQGEDLKGMDRDQQLSLWGSMNPTRVDALNLLGYSAPSTAPKKQNWFKRNLLTMSGGVFDATKDVPVLGEVQHAVGGTLKKGGSTFISPLMDTMDWLSEEMGRPVRAAETTIQGVKAADQAQDMGVDPAQLGIKTVGSNPWDVVKAWWQIGHRGEDDILQTRQLDAYDVMRNDDAANALPDFEVARKRAQGKELMEIADDMGLQKDTTPWLEFMNKYTIMENVDSPYRKAMNIMVAGKSSLGRAIGRGLGYSDADMVYDPAKPFWAQAGPVYSSGAADLTYGVLADPTIVLGKVGKGAEAARWGVETLQDIDEYRNAAKAYRLYRDADFAEEALTRRPAIQQYLERAHGANQSLLARRSLDKTKDLLNIGEAVNRPAEIIAEGFQTGDLQTVRRRLPKVGPSLQSMQQFHEERLAQNAAARATRQEALIEANRGLRDIEYHYPHYDAEEVKARMAEEGLTHPDQVPKAMVRPTLDDPDGVFDYFMHVREFAEQGKSGRDAARGVQVMGIDPNHLYIPHQGDFALSKIRDMGWYRHYVNDGEAPLPDGIREDIAEAMTDMFDEAGIDRSQASMNNVNVFQPVWGPPGNEVHNPQGFAKDFRHLTMDETKQVLGQVSQWDPERRGRLQGFLHAFTTHVPLHGRQVFTEEGGVVDGAMTQMFQALEMGIFEQMPRETIDTYANLLANGTPAQQGMVMKSFFEDLFEKGGLKQTEAGRTLMKKTINSTLEEAGVPDAAALAQGMARRSTLLVPNSVRILLPDLKEYLVATRKANALRMVSGTVNHGLLSSFFGRIWKPAQLIKGGFILRAAGEEAMSFMIRNSVREYVKHKVLLPWALEGNTTPIAGDITTLGELYGKTGTSNPVFHGLDVMAEGLSNFAGLGRESLRMEAERMARNLPEWKLATGEERDALTLRMANEYAKSTFPKRAIMHITHWTEVMANTSSSFFQYAGKKIHAPTRQEIGKFLLGPERDDLLDAAEIFASSEAYQQSLFSMGSNSLTQGNSLPSADRWSLKVDPRKNEIVSMPMAKVGEMRWAGMSDPLQYYMRAAEEFRKVQAAVGGPGALAELENFWPKHSLVKLADALGEEKMVNFTEAAKNALAQGEQLDLFGSDIPTETVQDLRHLISADAASARPRGLGALYEVRRRTRLASEEDKALLRRVVDGETDLVPQLSDDSLRELAEKLTDKSLRHALNPDIVGIASTSPTDLHRYVTDRFERAIRGLPDANVNRAELRAGLYDGDNVVAPIPDGVEPVYSLMFDRHRMPEITAMFEKQEAAELLAQTLNRHLASIGQQRLMPFIWDALPPSLTGSTVDDFVSLVAAKVDLADSAYVPGAMLGTPDALLAHAVQQAIDDTLVQLSGGKLGGLNSTLGVLYPGGSDPLMEPAEGFFARPARNPQDDWVSLTDRLSEPGTPQLWHIPDIQVVNAKPLDPANTKRFVEVELEGGKRMTYTEAELNGVRGAPDPTSPELPEFPGHIGANPTESELWASREPTFEEMRRLGWEGSIDGKNYRVAKRWFDTGVSENHAIQQTAQQNGLEAMDMFVGAESKEPLRDVIRDLREDRFNAERLWANAPQDDLPQRVWEPRKLTPSDLKFARFIDGMMRNFFDGVATPAIRALSHAPQMSFNTAKAAKQMRFVYDAIANPALEVEALNALEKVDAKLVDFKDFNRHYVRKIERLETDEWLDYSDTLTGGTPKQMRDKLSVLYPKATDLSDEEMEALRKWHLNQNAAWKEYSNASIMRGYDLTIPYIDDHRIRSQFQEYVGPTIPFWYAEEQFYKRVARGLQQTPWSIRKLQLMMHGINHMGFTRTDEQGHKYLVWPGSEEVMQAISVPVGLLFGDTMRSVVARPLEARVDYIMPGYSTNQLGRFNFGPIVGVPLDAATNRFPELAGTQEFLYGEDRSGSRSFIEHMMPPAAYRLFRAAVGSPRDAEMQSAQIQVAQMMEASGHGLPQDATVEQKENYAADNRDAARAFVAIRGLTGFFGFTTSTPVLSEVRWGDKYQDLLDRGYSHPEAVQMLMEENPAALPYTVFASENLAGGPLPASTSALEWMDDNETFLREFKYAAPWLVPQDDGSDFSRRAYNESISRGLRVRRSYPEWQQAFWEVQGAPDYYKMKDQYDADVDRLRKDQTENRITDEEYTAAKRARDQVWDFDSTTYIQQHPGFAATFTSEGADQRRQATDQLYQVLSVNGPVFTNEFYSSKDQATEFPDATRLVPLKQLVDMFHNYQVRLDAMKNLNTKYATEQRKLFKDEAFVDMQSWVWDHPELQGFWTSRVRPQIDNVAELESRFGRPTNG